MKLLLLVALLAVVSGRPQEEPEEDYPPLERVELLRSNSVQNPDGSFSYGYEQSDGQTVDVQGEQRQIGEEVGTVMRGSYSFVGDDGVTYTVTWVADENGFQATGDHLPMPAAY